MYNFFLTSGLLIKKIYKCNQHVKLDKCNHNVILFYFIFLTNYVFNQAKPI